jgi:hypothetical protein
VAIKANRLVRQGQVNFTRLGDDKSMGSDHTSAQLLNELRICIALDTLLLGEFVHHFDMLFFSFFVFFFLGVSDAQNAFVVGESYATSHLGFSC